MGARAVCADVAESPCSWNKAGRANGKSPAFVRYGQAGGEMPLSDDGQSRDGCSALRERYPHGQIALKSHDPSLLERHR